MKNKKASVIWNLFLQKIDYSEFDKIRTDLGIPKNGFTRQKDKDKWDAEVSTHFRSIGPFAEDPKNYDEMMTNKKFLLYRKISEIINNHAYLEGFDRVLEEYIFFGKVSDTFFRTVNSTGCRFVATNEIRNSKTDALFIRVGPDSTITDIKRFLMDKSKTRQLRELQYEIYTRTPTRYKSKDTRRNSVALILDSLPKSTLIEIFNQGNNNEDILPKNASKALLCKRLMVKYGYKMATEEAFRQLVSRLKRSKTKLIL
jgi:hypothetical protein